MTAVGPGDLVEAVDTVEAGGKVWCTKGEVRRIWKFVETDGPTECTRCGQIGTDGLWIEGINHETDEWVWHWCDWKPLPPSRKEMFNDLLRIPDVKELEKA